MKPTIAFVILYLVHVFVGHIPYPDYYYPGPVDDLKKACRDYWYATIFEGYKPPGEDEDDTDLITAGSDGETYLCDYEIAPLKGLDTDVLRPVGLSLP